MKCLIPGCDQDTHSRSGKDLHYFCEAHWFSLTLKMRKRWWDETGYGKRPPTHDLRAALLQDLRRKHDKQPDH